MKRQRRVLDRYIDRDLPAAIDKAVTHGVIGTEVELACRLEEIRAEVIKFMGGGVVAPAATC